MKLIADKLCSYPLLFVHCVIRPWSLQMGRLLGKPGVNVADEVKRNENVDTESLG